MVVTSDMGTFLSARAISGTMLVTAGVKADTICRASFTHPVEQATVLTIIPSANTAAPTRTVMLRIRKSSLSCIWNVLLLRRKWRLLEVRKCRNQSVEYEQHRHQFERGHKLIGEIETLRADGGDRNASRNRRRASADKGRSQSVCPLDRVLVAHA